MEAPSTSFNSEGTRIINVGSRKSQLALVQTNTVIDLLKRYYEAKSDGTQYEFNVITMTTTGDQVLDKPLPKIGTKSLFTRELEVALLNGSVDFVVHSLKDLPTTLPEGCVIGAILKRDSPEDTIVLKKSLAQRVKPIDLLLGRCDLHNEHGKIIVGTSSLRRIAMVKHCNKNAQCIDIRGNLNTRFAKLDRDGAEYDAIILAEAGLDRMGWSDRVDMRLSPDGASDLSHWGYAVGQGAIAVECRASDQSILEVLAPINDLQTMQEVVAERCLMKKLEAGCSVPLGVRSSWAEEAGSKVLKLDAVVLSVSGEDLVKAHGTKKLSRNSKARDGIDGGLGAITTGIVPADSISSRDDTLCNAIESASLGHEVANKLIDLGCLNLITGCMK